MCACRCGIHTQWAHNTNTHTRARTHTHTRTHTQVLELTHALEMAQGARAPGMSSRERAGLLASLKVAVDRMIEAEQQAEQQQQQALLVASVLA